MPTRRENARERAQTDVLRGPEIEEMGFSSLLFFFRRRWFAGVDGRHWLALRLIASALVDCARRGHVYERESERAENGTERERLRANEEAKEEREQGRGNVGPLRRSFRPRCRFSRATSPSSLFPSLPPTPPLQPQSESSTGRVLRAPPPPKKKTRRKDSSYFSLFLSLVTLKKKLLDAFADAADAEKKAAATEGAAAGGAAPTSAKDYVHIRVQQRNGRKSLTTIQGLDKSFDYKKIIKAFKKEFCCNGTVVDDAELGSIIQLQGDQRVSASAFLVDNKIVKKAALKIHGF